MIQRAKILEIPEILSLTRACAADMINRGIYQWNDHYPSKSEFREDITRQRLFVKILEAEIIGVIALCSEMDPEYQQVKWLTPSGNNLYVHRLAVHPTHQGEGHARELMDFAEEKARAEGYISIRLDTFSQNRRNQKFYEIRGYERLGDVYFPKQSDHPFYCYELSL